MKASLRTFALALAVTLVVIIGVTLWVGMRVGQAAVSDVPAAGSAGPSLLGERRLGFLLRDGHGAVGIVTSIEPPRVEVTGRDGQRRVILVTADTLLAVGDRSAPAAPVGEAGISGISDLKPGVRLVVIGQPDEQDELNARIIRIVPPKSESDRLNSDQPRLPNERKGKTTP